MLHLQRYEDFFSKINEGVHDIDVEARDKVKLAISLILVNLPFFAPLMIRLWVFEDKACKTMYTNGKSIAYGPKFVNSLPTSQVAWVLVHEIMHNVLLHFSRQKPNAELWNIAGDYAINLLIKNVTDNPTVNKRFVMPEGGLYDEAYKDMSAEQIYEFLEKNPNKQPKNFQNIGGTTGDTMTAQPGSVIQQGDSNRIKDQDESEAEEGIESGKGAGQGEEDENGKPAKPVGGGKVDKPSQSEDKGMTMGPASETEMMSAVAQSIGKASDAIRRYYDLMFKAQIDWKKELKRYIQEIFDKTKYKMPYRRFIHGKNYMSGPIRRSEEIKDVVVGIDTSGSIDKEMINEFLTEVSGIIQAYRIETLYVLSVDDKIRTINKFKSPRSLKTLDVQIKGGGGTDFIPVFDWIDENCKNFSIMVYITDAQGRFPEPAPTYKGKCIWAVKGSTGVPFGKRIQLGEE